MTLGNYLALSVLVLFQCFQISSGVRYIGCFRDFDDRILPTLFDLGCQMTNKACQDKCFENGFRYAGSQYERQCFCGNSHPSFVAVSPENCDAECLGNKTEICGGTWFESVYDLFEHENAEDLLPFVGCFEELTAGFRENGTLTQKTDCVKTCQMSRFKYAAVRGSSCLCSNEAFISEKAKPPPRQCDKGWTEVYFARPGYEQTYLGCYTMDSDVWGKGIGVYNVDRTCPEVCRQKGFRYSGNQNSFKCHCSNDRPSYKLVSPEVNCTNRCESSAFEFCSSPGTLRVFDLAVGHEFESLLTPKGCYEDIGKVLNAYVTQISANTPEKCTGLCYYYGYSYAAVKNGDQCRCGNSLPESKLDPEKCFRPCPGDIAQICGGTDHIFVYEIPGNPPKASV